MMYRAKRSFVDPVTGRVFLRGKSYTVTDERHANYLEHHGLIERMGAAPVEQPTGADAPVETPKRKKARR